VRTADGRLYLAPERRCLERRHRLFAERGEHRIDVVEDLDVRVTHGQVWSVT